jgi:hypothetical protein
MIPIEVPGVLRMDLLWVTATGGLGTAGVGSITNVLGTTGEVAGALVTTSSVQHVAQSAAQPPSTGTRLGIGAFLMVIGGLAVIAVTTRRRVRGENS